MGLDAPDRLLRRGIAQAHPHQRVPFLERGDGRHEVAGELLRRRHPKLVAARLTQLGERLLELLGRLEDGAGALVQDLAFGRQHDPPTCFAEEVDPVVRLQAFDAVGDGRRCDVEQLGGARETALAGREVEDAQLVEVEQHRTPLGPSAMRGHVSAPVARAFAAGSSIRWPRCPAGSRILAPSIVYRTLSVPQDKYIVSFVRKQRR